MTYFKACGERLMEKEIHLDLKDSSSSYFEEVKHLFQSVRTILKCSNASYTFYNILISK